MTVESYNPPIVFHSSVDSLSNTISVEFSVLSRILESIKQELEAIQQENGNGGTTSSAPVVIVNVGLEGIGVYARTDATGRIYLKNIASNIGIKVTEDINKNIIQIGLADSPDQTVLLRSQGSDGPALPTQISSLSEQVTVESGGYLLLEDTLDVLKKVDMDLLAYPPGFLYKYTELVGNGVDMSFVVTHNLNTFDVIIHIYDDADPDKVTVMAEVQRTSLNSVTILFTVVPAVDQFQVIVIG